MKNLKRNTPIAAAAFALIAVTAVAAVAQGGGEASPSEGAVQVTTIEAEAQEAMAVLDTPRTSSDAMPAEVAESIDEDAQFGIDPDLSRESIATLSNSLYVVPGNDHVCASLTLGDGANISCLETSDVAAGVAGPTTVSLPAGVIGIYGVVPDGVTSVTVETGVSSSSSVAVEDNAYFTALPAGTVLRGLSYTGPSGVVQFPLHDPALAFEE
jgi:hypothetical protein